MCLLPGGVCSRGMSAPRGESALGGCLLWGVCSGGVCSLGGGIPACTEADTVDRITENEKIGTNVSSINNINNYPLTEPKICAKIRNKHAFTS